MFIDNLSVLSMLVALPFIVYFEKIAEKLIKDKNAEAKRKPLKYIDNHLIKTPTIAMMQVKREIVSMHAVST